MSKKLSTTNTYLRDPVTRKSGLWVSAKTSSAVEGIRQPFAKEASITIGVSKSTGDTVVKSGGSPRGK